MPSPVDVSQNGSARHAEAAPSLFEIEEDLARLLERPRQVNIERKRSFDERSFSEMSMTHSPPRQVYRNSDNSSRVFDNMVGVYSPGRWSGIQTPRSTFGYEPHPIIGEAWEALRRSMVNFRGQPVGTIAAIDNSAEELNYDQVFVRDFVPSALAFLMNGEPDIVKNFLLKTLRLQSREKKIDQFKLGDGVMPASFKVSHDPVRNYETITADFGESAIGRVAPVDSGFWWIILLRAYTKSMDASEVTKNLRKEKEGERESNLNGFAVQSGNFEGLGNESGYGSEPGYRGDAEFGYGDEFDEEEDDQRLSFWGDEFGALSKMEKVGENTLQKVHHRCRRRKQDYRMVIP